MLIAQSTQPGELVIDPFMGSGSVGVAALQARPALPRQRSVPEAVRLTRAAPARVGAGRGAGRGADVAARPQPGLLRLRDP